MDILRSNQGVTGSIKQFVTNTQKYGFDGIEWMLRTADFADKAVRPTYDIGPLKELTKVIHAPTELFDNADTFLRSLERAVEAAVTVGAGLVNIHPPTLTMPPDRRSYVLEQLSQQPVLVALEVLTIPENEKHRAQQAYLHPDDWVAEVKKGLLATLDTTHLGAWGLDLLRYVDLLADQLIHIHVSDFIRHPHTEHVLVGQGELQLDRFVTAVQTKRPHISMSVELSSRYGEAGIAEQAAQDSLHYLRAALA